MRFHKSPELGSVLHITSEHPFPMDGPIPGRSLANNPTAVFGSKMVERIVTGNPSDSGNEKRQIGVSKLNVFLRLSGGKELDHGLQVESGLIK
jgi:hypothetical protein